MNITPFGALIEALAPSGEGAWAADPPDDWRQGRTLYGGLSAALCFAACERLAPGLPPLRSSQIAFVGPSAGEARLEPRILRQGKSVTFMACDLIADGAIATRALFCFGGRRESAYAASAPHMPDVPGPGECEPLFTGFRPVFAQHFDAQLAGGARPVSSAATGEMCVWVRHADANAPTSLVSLVALGDALPPASMSRFTAPAPISTMTWHFDLIAPERFDARGWHLLRATDDAVGEGYSGQTMAIWNADGTPLLIARQSVAVFG